MKLILVIVIVSFFQANNLYIVIVNQQTNNLSYYLVSFYKLEAITLKSYEKVFI